MEWERLGAPQSANFRPGPGRFSGLSGYLVVQDSWPPLTLAGLESLFVQGCAAALVAKAMGDSPLTYAFRI